MYVLGIDVGLEVCGFCICNVENSEVQLIREGNIKTSRQQSLPQKLNNIFEGLNREVKLYSPKAIIVERLYSHYRHPQTYGLLAQVRGVVALLAYRENIDFYEYLPTRVRKSFLGRGNVNSKQVQKMAENMTGRRFSSTHTADAFSLVITFSHRQKLKKILKTACHG